MARARNIKPGFYKNEDLAECSIWARFIFPGLWMLADREGRLEDRPKRIKGELLPFDSQDVDPLLRELESRGFIVRYQIDGVSFIQISKFSAHQAPHYSEKPSTIKPPGLPESSGDDETGKPENSGKRKPIKRGSQPPDSLIPDSLIPHSVVALSQAQPESRDPPSENATRQGALCRKLRALGIDAATHLQAWATLLPAYSDEEIIGAAQKARETKPGERIHLNYLVPILNDRKPPRSQSYDRNADRAATVAAFTGSASAARRPEPEAIDGTATRIA